MLPTTILGVAYVTTMRDTGLPEPRIEYVYTPIETSDDGYSFLAEIGYLRFYFRDDRDVIAVVDSRNGYTWKTGLDIPFNQDIDRAVDAARTDEEKIEAAIPREDGLNATFIALANSLLTVEYFDDTLNISRISSASRQGVRSQLNAVGGNPYHFVLDVNFREIDLGVKLHIHLTSDGLQYEIFDDEITGEDINRVAAFLITPFLGASGGRQAFYDPEIMDYSDSVRKPMIPGYVLIPDGPGALVRFRENSVSFNRYVGSVYGENPADMTNHITGQLTVVPYKEPLMPVYGIAHGDRQAAFVFWADEGDTYLEIIISPENNLTAYIFAYPRFVYNRVIYQVYNRAGEGYNRLFPERNMFDIDVTYKFLAGDGTDDGLPADYTGMAFAYREHLLKTGRLKLRAAPDKMPIHLDFVMSDIKSDLFGYRNMVTTTAHDVNNILLDLLDAGITNINAGMLGAQRNGITGGKPWTLSFTNAIGSRSDFRDLITGMSDLGVDVYFTQDYAAINSRQMIMGPNMASHRNSWGIRQRIEFESINVPVNEIGFARPVKSAEWINSQSNAMKRAGADNIGIDGVTSRLTSHHGSNPMNAGQAIELLRETIKGLEMTINSYTPNKYLWDLTDRFINTPLLPTQYIIETDTVPFLQMILNGTMELYGPYANFSFYTRSDILRMIDYNVYPSFVLTEEPAYLLSDTNSSGFYSTSYDLYRDIIIDIYNEMSDVYRRLNAQTWVGRDVLDNGVILNTYSGGTRVLINYTESPFTYEGHVAEPLSVAIWEGSLD